MEYTKDEKASAYTVRGSEPRDNKVYLFNVQLTVIAQSVERALELASAKHPDARWYAVNKNTSGPLVIDGSLLYDND